MQRVEDREEEDAGRRDRGRDVAEDVDLRPAWPLRPVAEAQRDPAGLERRAHRSPDVDRAALAPSALLVAEGRQAPLHLRDRPVDGREVLGRARRQRPVELGQRARWRQRRGALDQVAFELAPEVALEAVELVAVDRGDRSSPSSSAGCGPVERPRVRRIRWTSTPTTPSPRPGGRRRRSPVGPGRACRRPRRRGSPRGSGRGARRCRAAPRPRGRCPPSPISRATASASAARKNQRSKSSSNRRRSSCDLAIVAASASRKSSCEVQGTCSSAANASRISEVPTATPSERSSSQKPSSFAARPGGPVSARGP